MGINQSRQELLSIKAQMLHSIQEAISKVSRARYVHVMVNDKFNAGIVEFINANFDPAEHCFVFYRGAPETQFAIPQHGNVVKLLDFSYFSIPATVERVFFHGLFLPDIIAYLYNNRDLLKKSCWLIWGGDLHEAKRNEVSDFVKTNFLYYNGLEHDRIYLKELYNHDAKFIKTLCYSAFNAEEIESVPHVKSDYVKILVNNSAHPSTISALKNLAHFKDENIKIFTILSYGQAQYKEQIVETGKEIFGDKFIPMHDYIKAEDYLHFLASLDAYILNQGRPQGATTLQTLLLMGKKVFVRGHIAEPFKAHGLDVYHTESIPGLTFNEFLMNERKDANKKAAAYKFTDEFKLEVWRKTFAGETEPPLGA